MTNFQIVFLLAVLVTAGIDWLKAFLPEKVKDNTRAMSAIAVAVSAVAGFLYCLYAGITPITRMAVITGEVVLLVQTSYSLLFKTFQAIKERLKAHIEEPPIDPNEIADKIVDTVKETTMLTSTK